MKKYKLTKLASAVILAVGLSGPVYAVETSSNMRGQITNPQGQAAPDTKIIIRHIPSGTTKTVTTNAQGNFVASGLRVGGPYQITIDSDVYADQEISQVFLQLGKTERVNAQLETDGQTLVVTGTKLSGAMASGSSSYFGTQAIKTQSGITRDIKDIVRANPLVSILPGSQAPLTIAGMNPKFNSFTVGGISQNDDFGLSSGGFPTQRNPIPLDSLEQITVDFAPFDAEVSGFSGGLINAVFKSGTNDFKGSVWYEDLDSDRGPGDFDFKTKEWGANISGPIIKDKLFYMISYENFDSPQTLIWGAGQSGAPNQTDATLDDLAEVQRIAQQVYGLTADQVGSDTGNPVEEDEKLVIKIDWNVNEFHRAQFIYQFNDGNRTNNLTASPGTLRLSTNWYNTTETLNNFTAKLYSDWSEAFSTELSVTSKDVANRQVSFGDFADVTIQNLTNDSQIVFGSDRFRHANLLDTTINILKFDADYLMGEHSLEFGFEFQDLGIKNLFVPSSKGVIVFDSLTDFEAGLAESYTYSNGIGNDPAVAGADFKRQTWAFYAQDNWDVTDVLDVTLGLRYELLASNDKPPFNPNSLARTGIDNTENLDGLDILLPRLGINYNFNEDLTIRGGIGRYTGGQPNVWISNAFSENGANVGFFSQDNITVPGNVITNILPAAANAIDNAVSDGNVSFTDPNFKLPSDWRFQLAADYQFDIPHLGENFAWTTEFMYVKKKDSAFWVDASLQDATFELLADGQRRRYTDNDRRYDLMLTNSDVDARSIIFTSSLAKSWDNGLSFVLSYANQNITEINPGTSSTARSNFRFSDGINRGIAADQKGRGAFEIEHRIVLNLGYNKEIFDGYQTNVNLIYTGQSGTPVTYTTNFDRTVLTTDNNGEVIGLSPEFTSGDFTSYIPTAGDPNVIYTGGANEADLLAAIEAAGLTKYAGGFAPKKSATTPWTNGLDLSLIQEIPGLFDDQKGSVTIVFDNVLNLLNNRWGEVIDNRFGSLRLYDVAEIDQGRYVIDRVRNDSNRFNPIQSVWKIKLGVKYSF